MLNLYVRVRLPDGREGLLLGQVFQGPSDIPKKMDVLTDGYVRVVCRHNQVKVIRRQGDTAPLEDGPGGDKTKVYPMEKSNIHRLREAIWHDHYQKFGADSFGMYQDSWKSGDIKELPEDEDIREKSEAFAQQIRLF